MHWLTKVAWSEGLFLQPQMFQQQERYLENFAHERASSPGLFFWGFSEYEIDTKSLAFGKFVVSKAVGMFQDGTSFSAPASAALPAPMSILPSHVGQLICLSLPVRQEGAEEIASDELREDAASSVTRFLVVDTEVPDVNSTGRGAKSVQLASLRLRLRPVSGDPGPWHILPLARVAAVNGDGSVVLDNRLIPPVCGYGADARLSAGMVEMQGLCSLRAQALAAQLGGNDGTSGEVAQVSDFLLLQLLNRYEPVLTHLLAVPKTSPEQIFVLLVSLVSELCTYMRTELRRADSLPKYLHDELELSLPPLFVAVRGLLNGMTVRSAERIQLDAKVNGMRTASIDPLELRGFTSLVFSVASTTDTNELAVQFAARCKAGPTDRLAELVRSHLPGMSMQLLLLPPRQIPFHTGSLYFELDTMGPLWNQVVKHGGLGLHLGGEWPGLKLELWGIRGG